MSVIIEVSAYLAEFLLKEGYEVHGIKRRSSSFNTGRVDHLYVDPHEKDVRFFMHYGDLTDATNLIRIIQEIQPDEIYNLAAQSHVQVSFETAEYTANSDALGALRILNLEDKARSNSGLRPKTGDEVVRIDPGYFRPTEVDYLLGDPSKARSKLGWEPTVSFDGLVKMMVREDLKEAERDQLCQSEGFQTFNQFE